jgi:hypothetical protein
MKRIHPILLLSVIVVCLIIVSAVCWHSVEEIHYLKLFFPNQFSVEETFYASKVELVKIAIISLPLILIIGISLYFLHYSGKDS